MTSLINLFHGLSSVGIAIIIIITAVFVIAYITNLVIRSRYIHIQNDLLDWHRRKEGVFKSDILTKIIDDYKHAASGNYNEVNTQAIIEKSFNLRMRGMAIGERFIKSSNALLITLGLLGTFVGLTVAVGNISDSFSSLKDTGAALDSIQIKSLLAGLTTALGGMAVAFTTSLFGIGCSILLTILLTVANAEEARETLMVHIEEYLDNTVALVIAKDKETEYTIMNNILRETFMEFGDKIQATLKDTVESFGDKLTSVVMDVNVSSQALDKTVERFDNSLANFASNMKDLSEFNINMRNNIERMDVNFIKVTEALTKTSELVVKNYQSIESFSENIRNAADEMTSYNRQVIQDIEKLVLEVESTVNSVKKFAEAMDSEMQHHTHELRVYQENFHNLMTKLSNEIGTLGQHAALSFADALAQNSQELSRKIKDSLENSMKEIYSILEAFKENERIFAKTIASLPDQALTYSEAAVSGINKQLEEIKNSLQNTGSSI